MNGGTGNTAGHYKRSLEMYEVGLLESGLVQQPPGPPAVAIDEQVCKDTPCTNCGHQPGLYRPYTRRMPHPRYVALYVCGACGYWEEF